MYCGIQLYMSYVLWDTVILHVYTCSMYCGIQLYMSYVLWDTVIHVVCIVGDTVIHVVCIVGDTVIYDTVIHVVCIVGYSYTCRMHCGIQLYMLYVL